MRAEQTGSSLSSVSPHIRAYVRVDASEKKKAERMCGVEGKAKAAECRARFRHFVCQPSPPQKPDVFWGGDLARV